MSVLDSLWPDHTREQCGIDRSLAVAHGRENRYIKRDALPNKVRGKRKSGEIQ
ncbi:MAG: hypothetical protein ACFCVA_00170 [Gammaproteobacteria bacterium]